MFVFLAKATAAAGNTLNYPLGQRHAALLFVRQEPGTSLDWARAEIAFQAKGWSDVALIEAGPVSVDALGPVHPHASASYDDALRDGFAALIFSEPIDADTLTIHLR